MTAGLQADAATHGSVQTTRLLSSWTIDICSSMDGLGILGAQASSTTGGIDRRAPSILSWGHSQSCKCAAEPPSLCIWSTLPDIPSSEAVPAARYENGQDEAQECGGKLGECWRDCAYACMCSCKPWNCTAGAASSEMTDSESSARMGHTPGLDWHRSVLKTTGPSELIELVETYISFVDRAQGKAVDG
jgi:hypothetical protein